MAFFAVIWWMRSLASHKPTPRFLEADRRSSTGRAPTASMDVELPADLAPSEVP
jgi:hypothetical protein